MTLLLSIHFSSPQFCRILYGALRRDLIHEQQFSALRNAAAAQERAAEKMNPGEVTLVSKKKKGKNKKDLIPNEGSNKSCHRVASWEMRDQAVWKFEISVLMVLTGGVCVAARVDGWTEVSGAALMSCRLTK